MARLWRQRSSFEMDSRPCEWKGGGSGNRDWRASEAQRNQHRRTRRNRRQGYGRYSQCQQRGLARRMQAHRRALIHVWRPSPQGNEGTPRKIKG